MRPTRHVLRYLTESTLYDVRSFPLYHGYLNFSLLRVHTRLFTSFSACLRVKEENIAKKDVSGVMPTAYNPNEVESAWHNWWEKHCFFSTNVSSTSEIFTMVLPPPNVTGTLHLGHALTATVQDAISRWHLMHGKKVVWVPGTDHAGIATHVVVEKHLWASQKLTRHQLGREKFIKEISKWHLAKSSHIKEQLRRLGTMLDWNREFYTLDERHTCAVNEAFIRLFEDGLIYRRKLPVNWSCWLNSTISDIEVEYREIDGPTYINVPGYEKAVQFGTLTDIAFKLCDRDGEIVVSTTRPETIFGDVGVAVHPSDPRYLHLHGSQLWHPYRSEKIPLICDTFVNPEFGTGAVKITPAHDKTDYIVSMRHNLKILPAIDEHGNICDHFKKFGGMKRFIAREHIILDLESQGLLRGVQGHKTVLPICSRSGDIIELIPKEQWYLSVKDMKENALNVVLDGSLELFPKRMEKIWHDWFSGLEDWCLSRQLWWGHRVPAYKCYLNSDITNTMWVAARNEMEARSKASAKFCIHYSDSSLQVEQDEDVLDTWFSSSILPFSVFGWPETEKYKDFYPLSLLETGNDILMFWVARMVMLGQYFTKELPFNCVLLHGVICDAAGRKMSKSKGNVVSPEDVRNGRSLEDMMQHVEESCLSGVISTQEVSIAKENLRSLFPNGIPPCGTDALRFTLCSNEIQSQSINFNIKECYSNRLFVNKIWQACRYIKDKQLKINTESVLKVEDHQRFSAMDRWILSCLYTMVMLVDQGFKEKNLDECTNAIRSFTYDKFCDVYLESTKAVLLGDDKHAAQSALYVLETCMKTILLTLSPFMPFVTEELYQRMGFLEKKCQSIMQVPFPKPDELITWQDETLEQDISIILKAASAIRRMKTNNGFQRKIKTSVVVETNSNHEFEIFKSFSSELSFLGECNILNISQASDISVSSFKEERVTDCSRVKIVFADDSERNVSAKALRGLVINAAHKKQKLMAQISQMQDFFQTKKFKTKGDDYKRIWHAKISTVKEEMTKIEAFLSQEPELRNEAEQEIIEEKQRKQDRGQKKAKKM